jgi:hypothetical protein
MIIFPSHSTLHRPVPCRRNCFCKKLRINNQICWYIAHDKVLINNARNWHSVDKNRKDNNVNTRDKAENKLRINNLVGFEVLTAVVMKSSIFWDIMPSSKSPSAFKLVSCLVYSSALRMEATCSSSETSVDFRRTIIVNKLCSVGKKLRLNNFMFGYSVGITLYQWRLSQSLSLSLSLSCCSHLEHRAYVKRFVSLQFLNPGQSVGLLERGISPSQGRY